MPSKTVTLYERTTVYRTAFFFFGCTGFHCITLACSLRKLCIPHFILFLPMFPSLTLPLHRLRSRFCTHDSPLSFVPSSFVYNFCFTFVCFSPFMFPLEGQNGRNQSGSKVPKTLMGVGMSTKGAVMTDRNGLMTASVLQVVLLYRQKQPTK